MSKDAKQEATAAEAVKHLTSLAAEFNDSANNPESAAKLSAALADFIQRQEAGKDDLESVKLWVKTVQSLLNRAADMNAANKSGGRVLSSAAMGNIDTALSILNRLKDPKFAASQKKPAKDKIQPTMAVMPSEIAGGQRLTILGKSQVTNVPGGLRKLS